MGGQKGRPGVGICCLINKCAKKSNRADGEMEGITGFYSISNLSEGEMSCGGALEFWGAALYQKVVNLQSGFIFQRTKFVPSSAPF